MSSESTSIVYKLTGANDLVGDLNIPSGGTLTIEAGANIINDGTATGFGGVVVPSVTNLLVGNGTGGIGDSGVATSNLVLQGGSYANPAFITSLAWSKISSAPFSVTSGKTLTFTNSLTFSGTDGSTLNIGAGGTLGAMALKANVTESDLSLGDNTTANVTTARHGFAPKLPNDSTKFLNGVGAYTVPAGVTVPSTSNLLAGNNAGGISDSGLDPTTVIHGSIGSAGMLLYSDGFGTLPMAGTSWDNTNQSLTITSLATTVVPVLHLVQTWNSPSTNFLAALQVDVTNVNAGFGDMLANFTYNGNPIFQIIPAGVSCLGSVIITNGQQLRWSSDGEVISANGDLFLTASSGQHASVRGGADFRVFGSAFSNFVSVVYDNTNGTVSTSSGDLLLSPASGSTVDFHTASVTAATPIPSGYVTLKVAGVATKFVTTT